MPWSMRMLTQRRDGMMQVVFLPRFFEWVLVVLGRRSSAQKLTRTSTEKGKTLSLDLRGPPRGVAIFFRVKCRDVQTSSVQPKKGV